MTDGRAAGGRSLLDRREERRTPMPSAGEIAEDFWAVVRQAYPRRERLLNLNNASVSPPPLVVEDAATEALRLISRNPDVDMWNHLDAALPDVKAQLATLVDCRPEEIALNRNSTEPLRDSAAPGPMRICRSPTVDSTLCLTYAGLAPSPACRRY